MNEYTCSAMASAAATMLALLMIVFIALPLLFIMFFPHPQLIEEYTTLVGKIQGLIFTLGIIIALSLICALISLLGRGGEAPRRKDER
jgi:magnesium-transporting ATPase (P-type)